MKILVSVVRSRPGPPSDTKTTFGSGGSEEGDNIRAICRSYAVWRANRIKLPRFVTKLNSYTSRLVQEAILFGLQVGDYSNS